MIRTHESVDELKERLHAAESLDESGLACQLIIRGFSCSGCGDCCRSSAGDNRVIVFPDEISTIAHTQQLQFHEVCRPTAPQFIDESGILHAFEWELNRNNTGDCIFLQDNLACRIYNQRPWICRTYPFYLEWDESAFKPRLSISECRKCGGPMGEEKTSDLAISLKNRLIAEIREEIQVLNNLKGHNDWKLIPSQSGPIREKRVIVHDSRGSHIYRTSGPLKK